MADNKERLDIYVSKLSAMIKKETVSETEQPDRTKFYEFHDLLKELFPAVFEKCGFEDFDGSILLRWQGKNSQKPPVLLMNHHDTVAPGTGWKYDPFSASIENGKMFSRGTLDNKGGLCCMLQAAQELIESGFEPDGDIYFESSCTEETSGAGADAISKELQKRGIRFSLVLDEGGMIVSEPLPGAKGLFAMIGVAEKGNADLKFTARSDGGHASTPGKNTPLVRLGKFMAAAEKADIFTAEVSPVVIEMFKRIAPHTQGPLKTVFANSGKLRLLLKNVLPAVSPAAGAMLKTTLAFTMAKGSDAHNVIPQEAYVIGNMRFSHHQTGKGSIEAVKKLAAKYDIETEILNPGFESHISDFNSDAFKLAEKAVNAVFPGVVVSPYLMTGCSDCRFMSRVSDNCLRFTPFAIDSSQLETIHGKNENVDIKNLVPAVDFYKHIIKNV
ncbi:MAG: M20/M25/M40 family metallo-hydrolase [Clostridia bacterium]|nr:M20/M25/M40 family metallo-hydrolase [Clostridia bacterium]